MMKNTSLIKFTVVSAMIGLFSPSISFQPTSVQSASSHYTLTDLHLNVSLFKTAEARPRGGGMSRDRNFNSDRNINRDRSYNRNVNVNRDVNVNRNIDVNHRYYGGYGYYGGRPILAFTTGMVIGSIVAASTMPATCTTVVANGISYRQCGSSYYQPFYQGDTLVYKVVASPY